MTSSARDTWGRGRILIYAAMFPSLFWLDALTPVGVADWLLDIIILSIAAVWGTGRELRIVLVIASTLLAAGLFTSPVRVAPFWMGAVNRGLALVLIA